jgi:polyferredoxin
VTAEKPKTISLPVIEKRKHSSMRWSVLIAVQILILLHIGVWLIGKHFGWFGGKTLTPIEPSEGMEFVKNGVINAGAIFFALALISTYIFGRWFCGWGCHIVLLQDFCLWLMRKLGTRPKPFRSRWLMWFPFVLAVYMYIWPLFYRIVLAPWLQPELQWPEITTHLFTDEYWSSFGPPLLAIPFLLICGFATVYFLGAKGFCTYGCPYGGFFKPLDAISPMRVRVNDNCQQCGKCTAACTSNVRVHEEVHLYKMVIDSGCMKIMDCVDSCPNDALHIGFGSTSFTKRLKPRKYDLSLLGELCISIYFIVGFFAFRGMYAMVPMLMAVGMSLVGTWVVWKGYQILTKENSSFHKMQLRFHGRWKSAGIIFVFVSCSLFLFTLQSTAVRAFWLLGNLEVANNNLDGARSYYKLSGPFSDGGIGFASNPNIDLPLAKVHEDLGEYGEAQRILWRIDKRIPSDERVTMLLGQMMQHNEQTQFINSFYKQRLQDNSDWELIWEDYVGWLKRDGMYSQAIEASKSSIDKNPNAIRLKIQLVLLEIDFGDNENAISIATQMSLDYPNKPSPWMLLSRALDKKGDYEGARKAQSKAAKIQGEQ